PLTTEAYYRIRAPGADTALSTTVGQLSYELWSGYTKVGWCLVSTIDTWPELQSDMASNPSTASMWNAAQQAWSVTDLAFEPGEVISVYHASTPEPNTYSAIGYVPTESDISVTLSPGDNLVSVLPLRFGAV